MYLAPSLTVQLISCTIACVGFAVWFKVRGLQVMWCGIGAFITWLIYALIYDYNSSNFSATLVAAMFVSSYASVMARVNKAPGTIFMTACVFPLIPGPNLYYIMYGLVEHDQGMFAKETYVLFETCFGIAMGFIVIDIVVRYIKLFIRLFRRWKRRRRKLALAKKLSRYRKEMDV